MELRRSSRVPKLSSRLRGTDAEDRMTQGGGDGLGDEDRLEMKGSRKSPWGSSFTLMMKYQACLNLRKVVMKVERKKMAKMIELW